MYFFGKKSVWQQKMESNNEECGQRERNIRRIHTKERKHEKSQHTEKEETRNKRKHEKNQVGSFEQGDFRLTGTR